MLVLVVVVVVDLVDPVPPAGQIEDEDDQKPQTAVHQYQGEYPGARGAYHLASKPAMMVGSPSRTV